MVLLLGHLLSLLTKMQKRFSVKISMLHFVARSFGNICVSLLHGAIYEVVVSLTSHKHHAFSAGVSS